ncbi:MAG: hypothetical protein WD063_18365 [Pirellulales bacterium]
MHQNKGSDADPPAATVFPLLFTPFEYYYYTDDSPEYPMVFPGELRFSGTLVRDHFFRALAETVERHPMLRAVVDDSRRRPQWIAERCSGPHADWADESVPITHPAGEYIDLRSSPGLRTWVRTSPGGARVLFQFHHACCDGLAGMQFAADFLASYKIATGEDCRRAGRRELDVERLLRRGELAGEQDPKPSLGIALRDAYVTASVWSRILLRTPDVLAVPVGASAGKASPREILAFETETLNGEESAALRAIAASLDATPNDLLLRDFLLVLRDWNRRHASDSPGRLRINVPVNVRRREEIRMPVANRLGFGFVTAEPADADDPRKLLDVVRRETLRIKQRKLGLYFLGGLLFACRVPGMVPWSLRRNRSFATAVLSNVGRFVPDRALRRDGRWSCGDLVLDRVAGVPPIRKLTRVAVIVGEYGGETTFCLRCDPHFFDARETRALLSAFMERVRETLRRGN